MANTNIDVGIQILIKDIGKFESQLNSLTERMKQAFNMSGVSTVPLDKIEQKFKSIQGNATQTGHELIRVWADVFRQITRNAELAGTGKENFWKFMRQGIPEVVKDLESGGKAVEKFVQKQISIWNAYGKEMEMSVSRIQSLYAQPLSKYKMFQGGTTIPGEGGAGFGMKEAGTFFYGVPESSKTSAYEKILQSENKVVAGYKEMTAAIEGYKRRIQELQLKPRDFFGDPKEMDAVIKQYQEQLKRLEQAFSSMRASTKISPEWLPTGRMPEKIASQMRSYYSRIESEGKRIEDKERKEYDRALKEAEDWSEKMGKLRAAPYGKYLFKQTPYGEVSPFSENFEQKFIGVTSKIQNAREAVRSLNQILRDHKKQIDPETTTALKRWLYEEEKIKHGLDSGRLSLRNFSVGLKMVKTDIIDLMAWQIKWYGTKALIYEPLQKLQEAWKYAVDLDSMKSKLLRYPAMEGVVSSGDRQAAEEMMNQIRTLSVKYGIAAEEIWKSADRLLAAGLKHKTAMASLETFTKFQIAFPEVEMDKFSTALIGFLNTYRNTPGLKELSGDAERLTVILDKLTVALGKSVLAPKDVTYILQQLGQSAQFAGFSLDQMLALSATIVNFGDRARRAATSTRGLLDSLTNPKVEKVLKGIGIELNKDITLGEQFINIVKQLQEKAGVQQGKGVSLGTAQTLKQIAPVERSKPLQVLLQDLETYDNLLKLIKDSEGAVNRAHAEVGETLERKIERVKILSKEILTLISNSGVFKWALDQLVLSLRFLGTALIGIHGLLVILLRPLGRIVSLIQIWASARPGKNLKDDLKDSLSVIKELVSNNDVEEVGDNMKKSLDILWGNTTPVKDLEDKLKKNQELINKILNPPAKKDKVLRSAQEFALEKKASDERIKMIKDSEAEKTAFLESSRQLDIIDTISYYKQKYEIEQDSLKRQMEENEKFQKTVLSGEVYKEYLADIEKATEKGIGIEHLTKKYGNEVLEAERRKADTRKQILKSELDYFTNTEMSKRKIALDTVQYEFQLNEIKRSAKAEAILSELEEEKKKDEWLYSRYELSGKNYQEKEISFYEKVRDVKLKVLEESLNDKLNVLSQELIASWGNYEKELEIQAKTNEAIQNFLKERAQLFTDSANNIRETYRKLADELRVIFDNAGGGFSGIIAVSQKVLSDSSKKSLDMASNVANMIDSISNSMESAFSDFLDHTSSGFLDWKKLIMDILNSITQELIKVFIIKQLIGGLQGVLGANQSVGTGAPEGYSVQPLFGRASGGPVSLNRAYIVGENGPEIFTPDRNGNIIPTDKIGGGNVNVAVNVINNTKTPVNAKQSEVKFDGKQYIVGVVLDELTNNYGALRNTVQSLGRS